MGYADFVWFLLSEEDKLSYTAAGYWFRLLDLDGDGEVSRHEMEHFYAEQESRQRELSDDVISFRDVLCQLLDAITPHGRQGSFTLAELRASRMCPLVVNALCNITKFLAGEAHDLQAVRFMQSTPELTQFDRWALGEYKRICDDDDDDDDEEEEGFDDLLGMTGGRSALEVFLLNTGLRCLPDGRIGPAGERLASESPF